MKINNKLFYELVQSIDAMAMTSDGHYVITISRDGQVSIWDALEGRLESVFIREDTEYSHYAKMKQIHQLVLSADGSFAYVFYAVCNEMMSIEIAKKKFSVINTNFFKSQHFYLKRTADAMVLSPNDTSLLIASGDTLAMVNLGHYKLEQKEIFKQGKISTLSYNSKGFYFVVGLKEGGVILYSEKPLMSIWQINDAHKGSVTALVFSADTKRVISAGDDGKVKIWDFHTGRLEQELYAFNQKVIDLKLTDDEAFLLIHLENEICTFSMETFDVTRLLSFSAYTSAFMSTAQNKLVTHTVANGLQLYELNSQQPVKEFTKLAYGNNALQHQRPSLDISLDSRYLLTTISSQKIALWDMEKLNLVNLFGNENPSISSVTMSSDNQYVFAAIEANHDASIEFSSVEMYDIESGLLVYCFEIEIRYSKVILLRTTPDNRYLIAILSQGTLVKWDIESLECVENRGIAWHEYHIYSPTISPDASLIFYALDRESSWMPTISSIEIVDVATGSRGERINLDLREVDSSYLTIALSHDNRYVTLYQNNTKLFCWDRKEQLFVYEFKEHLTEENSRDVGMNHALIAPNGNYRVNSYFDDKKGLSVWSMDKGKELYRLFVAEHKNSLIVDVENNLLISEGEDEVFLGKKEEMRVGGYRRVDF